MKFRFFTEFKEETDTDRLFLFQEAIVSKFGFIQCLVESSNQSSTTQEHQYVHCTGTIFILISCPILKRSTRANPLHYKKKQIVRYSDHSDIVPSPHEAYITRHVSGKNKDDYDNSRKVSYVVHLFIIVYFSHHLSFTIQEKL